MQDNENKNEKNGQKESRHRDKTQRKQSKRDTGVFRERSPGVGRLCISLFQHLSWFDGQLRNLGP